MFSFLIGVCVFFFLSIGGKGFIFEIKKIVHPF